jgi:hypothetical protein
MLEYCVKATCLWATAYKQEVAYRIQCGLYAEHFAQFTPFAALESVKGCVFI